MSDTSYPTFQHYGTNAQRLAFTPAPAAGTQPIYVWYETDTGSTYLYDTTWHLLSSGAAGTVTHTGALTANELVVGNGAADIKVLAASADGQIPIGAAAGTVTMATLTAGANVTITNAAGSITIASTGGGAGGSNSFAFFIG